MAKDSRGGKRNAESTSTRSTKEFDTYDEYVRFMKDNKLSFQRDVNSLTAKNNKWVLDYTPKAKKLKAVSQAEKALQSRDNFKAFIKDQFKDVDGVNKITIAKETKQGNWGVYIQGKEKLNSRNRFVQYKTYIGAYENGKPIPMSDIKFGIELAKGEMELFYKK